MELEVRPPEPKRRKVRKGTRSCWECKGRKVRCTYMTAEDTVCDGCFRRGTKCVSQELPEQPLAPVDRRRQMGNRMVRVESLLEGLVKKTSNRQSAPAPSSTDPKSTQHTVAVEPPVSDSPTLYSPSVNSQKASTLEITEDAPLGKIAKGLLAVYPSQDAVDTIVKTAGPMPSVFHQLMRKPYKDMHIGEKEKQDQVSELTFRHTLKTHPLVIARQMLLLAITFRYIHPDFQDHLKGFSEVPFDAIQRLAKTAINLVLSHSTTPGMTGNIEEIECLLLVASFQADSGNLRSAWSTTRRAMLNAQLMCLHLGKCLSLCTVEPASKWDPQYLWYRIIYYDRFFSLLLGLPQGSTDTSMATSAPFGEDTPMGRLERQHCALAGRILRRNELVNSYDDLDETEAIDRDLRRLSETMPGKWWLTPNLASAQDEVQLFWETARLTNQVFHYILISHLHLPFILQYSAGPRYEYSHIACINASRDFLTRYMAFRTFNNFSYCCHSMDFFAVTASMTLLLTHLDSHHCKNSSNNALIHQRTSDRAIMEEILDNMEQVGTLNKANTVSERGAGVLRQLLAIEADAALGAKYRLGRGDSCSDDARALRLRIAYLGLVTITRDSQSSQEITHPGLAKEVTVVPVAQRTQLVTPESTKEPSGGGAPENGAHGLDFPGELGSLVPDPSLNTVAQGEWALDGVDMDFFDILTTGPFAQTDVNSDYWWLQ